MKIWRAIGIAGFITITAFQASAQTHDILERTAGHETALTDAAPLTFANPAFTPLQYNATLGQARALFFRDLQKGCVNPQEGKGEGYGALEAEAYIKSGSATLTGHAGYRNGTIFDLQWNESCGYSRVYPYVIADAVGGNLHQERYSFGGGYSSKRGKLSWGVAAGYTAGLYYRKRDPRPKAITGDFDVMAGIAYEAFNGYMLGIGGEFGKFRQQTDVEFVSELGESKVYHLTGLGTQYARFAGSGSNVYNDSYSYGGMLNIYPSGESGLTASVEFRRMTMRHVITDLNRLPMASLWENIMSAEGGWLQRSEKWDMAVMARWDWHCRHGREGIFGDPASGSYPLIGEIELFADNAWDLGLYARGNLKIGKIKTGAELSAGYSHHRQDYMSPRRHMLLNSWHADIRAYAIARAGRRFLLKLEASAGRRWDAGSSLSMGVAPDDAELRSLYDCTVKTYDAAAAGLTTGGMFLNADCMISPKYSIGIEASWKHGRYDNGVKRNIFITSLNFNF